MTSPVPFSKYSDAARWSSDSPGWVPSAHQERLKAYQVYEEVYWSHISTIKIMNRGLDAEDEPLYVPSARVVIDTMDRYVGTGLTFAVDRETGTPESQLAATQAFTALFARERFSSRYNAAKRDHLLRKGDMIWHVMYDGTKQPGFRLSLVTSDPASYFPTYEDELPDNLRPEVPDPDRIAQIRLVERVQVGDTTQARVQLYDRTVDEAGTIYSSLTMWKEDEWFQADKTPLDVLIPPTPLPPQVVAMPVYHVPNGGNSYDFGDSEMRGLLGLQAALNQSATDRDLAIALMGLGVFATDEQGSPVGPDGETRTWAMYPGVVIENAKGLRRVQGITSVQPYTDHVGQIEGYLADATGATDAARGRLEVTEAESGIALQLKMGPTLAKAAIKDRIILDVHSQMFYDLVQMWLPLDGINVTDVRVYPVLGDKLPVNKKVEAELMSGLYVAGLISGGSARKHLESIGFKFDPQEAELILAEKVALAAAEAGDPVLGRETEEQQDQEEVQEP